jgi:hypothetical protein
MRFHGSKKVIVRLGIIAAVCALASTSGTISAVSAGSPLAEMSPDGKPVLRASCSVGVQNPHYSAGARGVIAKPFWRCPATDIATIKEWLGNLYRCASQPDRTKPESTWTRENGCRVVRSASGGQFTVPTSSEVIRYIPAEGTTGATRGAYFIACVRGYWLGDSPFANVSNGVWVA